MAKHRPECFFILARGFSPTTLKWSLRSLGNPSYTHGLVLELSLYTVTLQIESFFRQ